MSRYGLGKVIKPEAGARLDLSHWMNQGLYAFFPLNDGPSTPLVSVTSTGNNYNYQELVRGCHGRGSYTALTNRPVTAWDAAEGPVVGVTSAGSALTQIAASRLLHSLLAYTSNYTVVARIKWNGAAYTSWGIICSSGGNERPLALHITSGYETQFVVRDDDYNAIVAATVGLGFAANKWYTIAGLRSGKSGWAYGRGDSGPSKFSAVNTQAALGAITPTTDTIIGASKPSASWYSGNGWISYIAIYDRLLSQSELDLMHEQPWGSAYAPRFITPGAIKLSEYDVIPALTSTFSDSLAIPSDALAYVLQKHRIAGISDSLIIPTDDLYPDPIEAIHRIGAISDNLPIPQDSIDINEYGAFDESISDSLPVIQDSITAAMINLATATHWVAPLAITPRVTDVDPIYLAAHPVRHPDYYFAPKIKSYGVFSRAIEAPVGFIRSGDVALRVIDADNDIRQGLSTKTIRKAKAELRFGPEGGHYFGFLRPYKREVGLVSQPSDGELSFQLQDRSFDFLDRDVPNLINTTNFPNLPENPTSDFANHVIGIVSSPYGALPCTLVDEVNFRYLVCRHIAQSVDEVWRKGPNDPEEFVLVDPSEYTIKTDYWIEHELESGDYCTLIEFSVDQESAEIRANVHGYMDANGNLALTNFSDAILSIFEYLAWTQDRFDLINLASFEETKIAVADLLCAGAFTETITFAEALTQLQRSSNIDIFEDKNGRIAVHYTTDDEDPSVHLDDLLRIYKGTVSQQLAEPTYNQIPYRYSPNYAAGTWTNGVWDNPADQTALDEIIPEETLNMYWVRDVATAMLVVDHRGQWLDLDSFRFAGEIPLVPVIEDLELADLVSIEHFGGIKAGGYVSEQFKILELGMDIDNLKYHFRGIRRHLPPPSEVANDTITGHVAINSRIGPHSNSVDGELFAIFQAANYVNLHAWTTSNYGVTWAIADETNEPSLSNNIDSFDSFVSGSTIHVATQEQTSGRVAYHTFSMASKTWIAVDQEVVAGVSNVGKNCVSMECRYPGGEPLIFFQGDRELVSGSLWHRGYYSMLSGGSWSIPVLVTPTPLPRYSWASANCNIQRVFAGNDNRMHFFWAEYPGNYVASTDEEYNRTMQEDLSFSGAIRNAATASLYYAAPRNTSDACLFDNRTKLAFIKKSTLGHPAIDIYAEGPSLMLVRRAFTMPYTPYMPDPIYESFGGTDNPAAFVREIDGILYAGQATWVYHDYVSMQTSDWDGAVWTTPVQASANANNIQHLCGTFIKVRGHVYMAYFSGPNMPQYRWLKVDDLPYTG